MAKNVVLATSPAMIAPMPEPRRLPKKKPIVRCTRVATLVHRTIGFFFGNLRGSGMGAIIAGLVASTTFFAMPVLRFFGKDRWFLNRELREEIKRSEAVDTPEIQDV